MRSPHFTSTDEPRCHVAVGAPAASTREPRSPSRTAVPAPLVSLVKKALPGPAKRGEVPPASPHASATGALPGALHGWYWNTSSMPVSLERLCRFMVHRRLGSVGWKDAPAGGKPRAHVRATEPDSLRFDTPSGSMLVPVHAAHPMKQPCENQKQDWPFMAPRSPTAQPSTPPQLHSEPRPP